MEEKNVDEYDFDSSDEEDIRNTVGNIPMEWYDDLRHVGYDTEGRPIIRPDNAYAEGAINQFLNSEENADYWRTVKDPTTGQAVVMSDKDISTIRSIIKGRPIGDGPSIEESYWGDVFTGERMETPLTAHPPQKRSFIPSRADRIKVGRMVYAIKMGWMKPPEKRPPWEEKHNYDSEDEAEEIANQVFKEVWSQSTADEGSMGIVKRLRQYMRPPQEALPGHDASYNPPEEYLLSKEEEEKLMEESLDPDSKVPRRVVIPHKYVCLRHVPFSVDHIRDRFDRVRDLFMAPRLIKERVKTTPEALLPKIPSLADLRPYPSRTGLIYKGHTNSVECVSVSPCGLWVASASRDGTLRIWESASTYCFRTYQLVDVASTNKASRKRKHDDNDDGEPARINTHCLAWNTNPDLHLVSVAFGNQIFLINPALGDSVKVSKTEQLIKSWYSAGKINANVPEEEEEAESSDSQDDESSEKVKKSIPPSDIAQWSIVKGGIKTTGKQKELSRITITLKKPVHQLEWHSQGDYLMSLSKGGSTNRVLLHKLSQFKSQQPFTSNEEGSSTMHDRGGDMIEKVTFHPVQPILYLASTRQIKVIDLANQKLLKTLRSGCDYISTMHIHPSGDHLLLGSYEGRFDWFDLDMGHTPFKKLKLGHGSVRQITIHRARPLVAATADDGALVIIHGKVTSNLLDQPVIVPVQIIRAHQVQNNFGSLACSFHPRQAYVYSSGADHLVKQFVPWN